MKGEAISAADSDETVASWSAATGLPRYTEAGSADYAALAPWLSGERMAQLDGSARLSKPALWLDGEHLNEDLKDFAPSGTTPARAAATASS